LRERTAFAGFWEEEDKMALLIFKILGGWSLLSAIAAFTWSRCMATGRCLHVNEIVVEINPRRNPARETAVSQIRVESFEATNWSPSSYT